MKFVLKLMASIMLCATASVRSAITIDGVDINKIAKPGEVIIYTQKTHDHVVFSFKNNNLVIGALISPPEAQLLHDAFQEVQAEVLRQFTKSTNIFMESMADVTLGSRHMVGKQEIALKARQLIDIKSSILQSPYVVLSAPQINCYVSFLKDAQFLQLENSAEDSLFKIIRFKMSEKSLFPYMIHGPVNLHSGEAAENFTVFGTREVEILFNESAFKN